MRAVTASLAIVTALFAACTFRPSPLLLGESIPPNASNVFVVHNGRRFCSSSVSIGGIEYNFDIAWGGSRILYVQTLDPKFVTREGAKTGATLRDAIKAGGRVIPSGECGVKLPSGWIARPRMGADNRGQTRKPCEELLDEEIVYFDTEVLSPDVTNR